MKKQLAILLAALAMGLNMSGGEITNVTFRVLTSASASEVEGIQVRMKCDVPKCAGEMTPTYEVICAYSRRYPHRCNVCGRTAVYSVLYPELRCLNRQLPEIE